MKRAMKKMMTNQRWTLQSMLHLAAMVAAVTGMSIPSIAAPPLPREHKPKPSLTAPFQPGVPTPSIHPGTQPTINLPYPVALPDLKIVQVTPSLLPQSASACQAGRPYHDGLIRLDMTVKNVGQGVADLHRYVFATKLTTMDGQSPVFFARTSYPHGEVPGLPGQTFQIRTDYDATDIHTGILPVSRYAELAGKTRQFKIELITGTSIARGLVESNYNNNSATVSYKFPSNFCEKNMVHAGVAQPVGTLKPHLVIQSIQTNLRHPYECRTDGPTFADGDLVLKNTGADFIPDPATDIFNIDGTVRVGSNLLGLRSVIFMRSRIPSGGTQHLRFEMTGTAGVLHRATPPMSSLAGRTVPLVVHLGSAVMTGNRNSSIHFPADFCASRLSGAGVSSPIGTNNVIKPTITNLQFASGKSCVAPEGVVTIVGSGFGNAANGRDIELGGNGVGIKHIPVESWSNTRIRVHLPRDAHIRYNENYWLAIESATGTHQSNLQRGVRLCPPTVHVGTSAGQNGGSRPPVEVTRAGLPDLEISRFTISRPSPDCFNLGTLAGAARYYTLPILNASITLHNIGPVTYTTHDSIHNRELPIGIIGDKYVGPPDSHNISLCMAPVAQLRFANLVIPAGGTKTIQTKLTLLNCVNRGDRVVNFQTLKEPLVRGLLGTSHSVNIGVGKAVFISNEIPVESSYENNFRRFLFKFPNRTCADR